MLRRLFFAVSVFFALVAVAAVLSTIYLIAYRTMGSRSLDPVMDLQIYEYEWQEYFFRPAAKFESLIRKKSVDTAHTAD
jgi:hypothetical protein